MDAKRFYRGSEWRKWDLHVHSPASYINGFRNWDSYIKKLNEVTKQKDIKVLGITDYFSIEGYEKITTDYKDRLENVELTLPNIEFRLDNIVYRRGSRESRRLNFHVIFSKEVSVHNIKSQFLEELHFYKGSGNAGELSKIKLDKRAIENYGAECKKQDDFKDDSDLVAGTKNIVFKIDEIIIVLKNKPEYFRGKYLLFLESEFWSDIDWGQDYGLRKTLLQVSHGVFNSNPKDIAWFIGKDMNTYADQQEFIEEFGRLFPCVHGSDAHNEHELETRPDLDRYCWIKADPTFEGLKQIVCEPEERVYIGLSVSKSKNDANVIDKIEIKNSNHWFEEEPILLNENLVTVIGEKGAGKTALADFVALAGGDFNIKGDDPGSFVSKALKSTKQIEETIDKCLVTIHWRDGSHNQISITKDFGDYKEVKKVRYLSQSFIERKCHPERAEELQKEIEDIIFQHIPIQDRMEQTTFVELKKLKSQGIEVRKTDCSKLIATLNEEIFGLEEEINSLSIKKEEKSRLETEKKQLEEQKPKPQTEEEKSIEAKLTLLNNRKNTLNEQIAGLKLKLSTIETIKVKVVSLKEYVQGELSGIKKDLESVDLGTLHGKLKFSVEPDFNTAIDGKKKEIEALIKKLQGTVDQDKNTQEKQIEPKQVALDELTDAYVSALNLNKVSPLISALESKSSIAVNTRKTIKSFDEKIAKNQKRIEELDKNIKDIEETKKPLLPKKRTERDTAYKKYIALLQEEKQIMEDIYSPLKEKLNKESIGEKNQIDFFARIELNVNEFFGKADKVVDFSRVGTYCRKGELLFKEIKSLAEKIEIGGESDVYSLITQLYKTFEESDGKPVEISNQLLKGKKRLDFYKWIFDVSDFKVNYSIKYQDTNIELLSPGKKGIVLLLMYLALDTESSIPLIIDQPEENLDNKSLYPHLVDYFKIAKKRRQIIIVTHNPNLVLNTDAEQIIVANFEAVPNTYKARITYISGAIENSYINKRLSIPLLQQGIREHGADILEGGKVAFVRRKDRYEY